MNILAIADAFIPAEVMEPPLSGLQPSHLQIIEWQSGGVAEVHQRNRHIERDGPDAEPPPQEVWDHLSDAELIVTHMCPVNREMIHRAEKLRMIGVCRAGTENIDKKEAEARNIRIYTVPGRNATAVAEYTVGLMLAERRNIARSHLSLATGGWRKQFANTDQFTELAGKTVGLIGFGFIGQMVATRLKPFEVQLLVYDPFQRAELVVKYDAKAVGLEDLLRQSDVVSLHARANEDAPPLIGQAELDLMKTEAYLINTARAYLIDVDALADALRHQRIAGAALDVYEVEPLPEDSPLRGLDNITLTPHMAGSTVEAFHNALKMLVEAIRDHLKGQPK